MSEEASLGNAGASVRAWFRRAWSFAPLATVLALATSYVVYVCYRQYGMLLALMYPDFDMSNYHQKVWLLSRFKEPFLTTRGLPAFGDHATFIDVLLVPIYWIVSTPLTLLWGETIALGLAGLMVYLIARHRLQSAWMGVCLSAMFLLYPAVHYLNFFNYHPGPFGVLFFLMFWYGFEKNRGKLAFGSALLLMSVKESFPAVLVGTAVYLYVFRKWKPALRYMLMGVACFAFMVLVLIPTQNKNPQSVHGNRVSSPLPDLLRGKISMLEYARISNSSENGKYVRDLLDPVGWAPALKPLPVLLNPVLYFNLTTQWPYAHRIEYHYTAEIMGSIFVSLIEAIAFIAMVCAKCRIRRAYAYCGILALLATSVVATNKRDQEYFRFSNITADGPRADRVLIEEMLSLKEKLKHKDVSVYYRLLPFFADRDVCYRWPNPLSRYDYGTGESVRIDRWPEYILLERPYLTSDDVSLLDEYGYVEDSRTDKLVLYRATRRDSAGRAESLYDAAVLGDTQLSNEVLAGSIAGGVSNRIIYVDGRCGTVGGGAKQLLSGTGKVRSHGGDFYANRDQLFQSGLLVMQYAVGRPEPTEAEYEIIRRYVANGGRLLLMCPAWVWPAYDKKPLERLPYRRIAEQFGLKVETEYAKPPLKTGRPPFKAEGVGDVLQLPGTYSVIGYPPGSAATPIVVGSDGRAAAVAAELGKARIIVWGQDNLLSAEAAGRSGAVAFVGEAVQWLFSEPQRDGGGGAN